MRKLRVGETGITRGVEHVEEEKDKRQRTSRTGGEGVGSEMKSRGNVVGGGGGGGDEKKDVGKGSAGTFSEGGGGGRISTGGVGRSWGKVDQEESWIERS